MSGGELHNRILAQTSVGTGGVDMIAKGTSMGKRINQEECENM